MCYFVPKIFKQMNRAFFFVIIFGFSTVTHTWSQSSLTDRLREHVYTLASDSLEGRQAGTEFSRKAAAYIVSKWEETGITPLNGDTYYIPFLRNRYENLAGIIEGNHPVLKDEYIIVGAHYDHLGSDIDNGEMVIYNGADDNASGTATVIELGRLLKEMQPSLGRSVVLIAFDAEEMGLYGSNNFASNPPFPIKDVKLMLSVDMVGWYKESGYLKYLGSGTIKNGRQLILDSKLNPHGLNVKPQKYERNLLGATDTQGFAQKGVATLAVTTGLKSPYHKPEDVAELIDYDGMTLITEHLANLIQAVSADENYMPSGKHAAKHRPLGKIAFGISANFGSNYHYYSQGVHDGKPAFGCGMGLSAKLNKYPLTIRPELSYAFLQAYHPPRGKLSSHSLTVPLNIVFQTDPSQPAGVGFFLGPYYRYRISGKHDGVALDFKDEFHRDEIGINFGAELRVSRFFLGITSRQAFSDFSRIKKPFGIDVESHIRNRSLFTTFGYLF